MLLNESEQKTYDYLFGPKLEFDSTAAAVPSNNPVHPTPMDEKKKEEKKGIFSKIKKVGSNIYNGAKQGYQLAGMSMGAVHNDIGAAAGMIHGAVTSTKKGKELSEKIQNKVL